MAQTLKRDSRSQGEGTRGHAQLKSDLSSASNGSLGGTVALGRGRWGLTEGSPVEMETTWFYEREQFIGRRRLEEKEAVLIARPGSQLQGLVQTGHWPWGKQGQQRGRYRQATRGRLPWRGYALSQ